MGEFSQFISDKRRAIPTPAGLVDKEGRCVFGTFDKEFESMELLKLKRPTAAPNCFNRLKLSLWEATEIHFAEGVLIVGLTDMGLFGKTLTLFYDKRDNKVYCWNTTLSSKATVIAQNLIHGAVTEAYTPVSAVRYENTLNDGRLTLKGWHKEKCVVSVPRENRTLAKSVKANTSEATIEYDLKLTRLSLPSVVSIPFPYSDNRPLYSQKDFLKAEGHIVLNGEVLLSTDESTAIVDDHKGFYPRHAHYDWVTTMGTCTTGEAPRRLALNLTRNQSVNQDDYNENLIWFEDSTSLLPPVTFQRSVACKDFKTQSEWSIKDRFDMVNLTYRVHNLNPMILHAAIVKIDYYITFGTLYGYVRTEEGEKIVLDGMIGLGEDKTLLL